MTDCEILLEMYYTMGAANWQKGASRIEWDVTEPSNCCAWEGVRCHADRPGDDIGIVEQIWLQEVEGMSGTLPVSIVRLGALGKLRRAHPQLRLCREGMKKHPPGPCAAQAKGELVRQLHHPGGHRPALEPQGYRARPQQGEPPSWGKSAVTSRT